jgi:hypothetical protein
MPNEQYEAEPQVCSLHTVPCVLSELQRMADHLKPGMVVAEIGNHLGHYAHGLKADRCPRLSLELPNEQPGHKIAWPIPDDSVDFLVSVNLLQSVTVIGHFVKECARVTRTTHLVSLVTRSHDDLKADTFARFFPDTASSLSPTLPEIPVLENLLQDQGLYCMRRAVINGSFEVSGESKLRPAALGVFGGLVREDEIVRGMDSWGKAISSGDNKWESQFTLLVARKVRPWHPAASVSATAM